MPTGVTASKTGNPFIDGVLIGTKWSGPLTYSFADSIADFGSPYRYSFTGFQEITAAQQFAIRYIIGGNDPTSPTPLKFTYGSFTDVATLPISLAANPSGLSDIVIGEVSQFNDLTGSAGFQVLTTARVLEFPNTNQSTANGDVVFGNLQNTYRSPKAGDFEWATHIHELGHAFGLAHGHSPDSIGGGSNGDVIPAWRNSFDYSIMTYSGAPNSRLVLNPEKFGNPTTLMMYDIAALQHLYGANYATNAGNTTYTWSPTTGEMFVNGIGQGLPGAGDISFDSNKIFLTIWDGNGIDTYDMSNYTVSMHIDIAPGESSRLSLAQRAVTKLTDLIVGQQPSEAYVAHGNVFNSLLHNGDTRSLIENANGGSANDFIDGNQANNILVGNGGHDIINGREGNDTIVGGSGNDILLGDKRNVTNPSYDSDGFVQVPFGTQNTPNNIPGAFDLTPHFGTVSSNFVYLSDTNPHVTAAVAADNNGQDVFKFFVSAPGVIYVDIDFGTSQTNYFNSLIALYDATNLNIPLSTSDESGIDPGSAIDIPATQQVSQPGSEDPFLSYGITTPGLYYVIVDDHIGRGVFTGDYQLSITLPIQVETPASEGNDQLFGGSGTDTLIGHGGNDRLSGGTGADSIFGGSGTDTIAFNDATSGVTANLTTNQGTRGEANGDTYDSIEYIVGSAFGDQFVGSSGRNIISAGDGNDSLTGAGGNDLLRGGNGNDLYFVSDNSATIQEGASQGTQDRVIASSDYQLDHGVHVELLTTNSAAGTSNIDLIGNSYSQTIIGNEGANFLSSGGGAPDSLRGRGGNDTYRIQNANDVILENVAQGNDRAITSVSYTLGSNADIELFTTNSGAGTGNLNLIGNQYNQKIVGNYGNNYLSTGGGAADVLQGLKGNDTYRVYNSADVILENVAQGNDRAITSVSYALGSNADIELFTTNSGAGTDNLNLVGNQYNQKIVGNFGNNYLSTGGGAADVLQGLKGSDTYRVYNSSDVILENVAQGNDRAITSVSYTLGSNADIELFTTNSGSGTGDLNLTGNQYNQTIVGNYGDNYLSTGGGANNTLQGLKGNDTYRVFHASDKIIENVAQGNDRAITSVSYELASTADIELFTTHGGSGTSNINLTGNQYNQTIVGNNGNNRLDDGSGAAADTLQGLDGNDVYVVHNSGAVIVENVAQGYDQVATGVDFRLSSSADIELFSTTSSGGTSSIDLTGNKYNQTIVGNNGNNIIDGKGDADVLRGLGGNDTFAFSSTLGNGNIDEIVDFSVADDQIRLNDSVFSVLPTGGLSAGRFRANSTGTAQDASDKILYDTNSGELYYDADGHGSGAAIQFAQLSSGLALTHLDFEII